MSSELVYCSFCGKNQYEVRKIIAASKEGDSQNAAICDECVELIIDILEGDGLDVSTLRRKKISPERSQAIFVVKSWQTRSRRRQSLGRLAKR